MTKKFTLLALIWRGLVQSEARELLNRKTMKTNLFFYEFEKRKLEHSDMSFFRRSRVGIIKSL